MLGAIVHRGPDEQRVHAEPGLALGVRRLAIVDIEDLPTWSPPAVG